MFRFLQTSSFVLAVMSLFLWLCVPASLPFAVMTLGFGFGVLLLEVIVNPQPTYSDWLWGFFSGLGVLFNSNHYNSHAHGHSPGCRETTVYAPDHGHGHGHGHGHRHGHDYGHGHHFSPIFVPSKPSAAATTTDNGYAQS